MPFTRTGDVRHSALPEGELEENYQGRGCNEPAVLEGDDFHEGA